VFIEVVDSLRCPNRHAESWLVASCDVMDHRDIVEGRLGCPVCKEEYPIREGAVWFDVPPTTREAGDGASETVATRIAAFLDLTDPSGFAVLEGSWAAHAVLIAALSPTPLVLLNPGAVVDAHPGVSTVYCRRPPPFAVGSARGIAMSDQTLALVDVLRPGGRALAGISRPVPPGLVEIARDDVLWLAEKRPAVVRVTLTARGRD
jgi:uncharacterized protein YbaR (Trm112 family)